MNAFDLRCPQCAATDHIDIVAQIYVRVTADGTDPELAEQRDHEWDDASPARCTLCHFNGTVTDFRAGQTDPAAASTEIDPTIGLEQC